MARCPIVMASSSTASIELRANEIIHDRGLKAESSDEDCKAFDDEGNWTQGGEGVEGAGISKLVFER